MKGKQEVYEFKKTARHDCVDSKTAGVWDEFGRYFVIYGVAKGGFAGFGKGKELRHIKFYSIFGEPLLSIDKVPDLTEFQFRPRPKKVLKKDQTEKLKKTFRK